MNNNNKDEKTLTPQQPDSEQILQSAAQEEYKYGFVTDVDTHVIPKGLNETG